MKLTKFKVTNFRSVEDTGPGVSRHRPGVTRPGPGVSRAVTVYRLAGQKRPVFGDNLLGRAARGEAELTHQSSGADWPGQWVARSASLNAQGVP